MFVNYFKDVSALLTIIRPVRRCNIEMNLEAERALLPQLFPFGHQNYIRYLTYHVALLEVYRISNTSIWKDLSKMVLEVVLQETNFLGNMEIVL